MKKLPSLPPVFEDEEIQSSTNDASAELRTLPVDAYLEIADCSEPEEQAAPLFVVKTHEPLPVPIF